MKEIFTKNALITNKTESLKLIENSKEKVMNFWLKNKEKCYLEHSYFIFKIKDIIDIKKISNYLEEEIKSKELYIVVLERGTNYIVNEGKIIEDNNIYDSWYYYFITINNYYIMITKSLTINRDSKFIWKIHINLNTSGDLDLYYASCFKTEHYFWNPKDFGLKINKDFSYNINIRYFLIKKILENNKIFSKDLRFYLLNFLNLKV